MMLAIGLLLMGEMVGRSGWGRCCEGEEKIAGRPRIQAKRANASPLCEARASPSQELLNELICPDTE